MPSPRRVDPLQCLYKRRQIDRSQYLAGCAYRRLISGGPAVADRLQELESALAYCAGGDGVELVRAILAGSSIEQAARAGGARSRREFLCWGWYFRRALDALAIKFGYVRAHGSLAAPEKLDVLADTAAQHPR